MRKRHAERVVAALLDGPAVSEELDAERKLGEARQEARRKWGRARVRAWRRASEQAEAAWNRLLAAYDGWDADDIPDLPAPPEQAEADAIYAELNEAVEYDRWPAHLYWSL